jgi:hypothetical protein
MDRTKAKEVINLMESDGTLGGFPHYIAGSYRRGKKEGLHDVDVVIVNPLSSARKEQITVLDEQVDLFYCDETEFGPMYMTLVHPQKVVHLLVWEINPIRNMKGGLKWLRKDTNPKK